MKSLALLAGLLITGLGTAGLLDPEVPVAIGRHAATPVGLYVVGAVRVAIGLVLMGAAPASRAPNALRAIGGVIFVAGVMTPLTGVERARAFLDWWSGLGRAVVRWSATFAALVGLFIVYAVADGRRNALRPARSPSPGARARRSA